MSHWNTRGLVLATLALGALWAVAPEAQAKGRKNRNERVELVRSSGSPDTDATGTIEVRTARRGPDAVLRVRNLEPRSDYLVVDGTTGDTLGTLDTNRRGRGRFNFGAAARGKRNGADGTDADAPDEVEVVDPVTGETVLEGEVPDEGDDGGEADYDFAYGYADYASDAGDFASVFLSSFPEFESESFYLSFYPAPSEDDEHGCWCVPYYDFYADTLMGDELPLGVDSASDLAGRKFRIVDTEGNAVVEGTLPEMEEFDYDDYYPCPGDDGGEKPDGDDGTNTERHRSGLLGGARDDGSNDDPGDDKPDDGDDGDGGDDGDDGSDAPEYRLEIAGDDGEFVDVGALNVYDWCDDWYWIEPWYPEDDGSWDDWGDEWSDDWADYDWTGGNGVVFVR